MLHAFRYSPLIHCPSLCPYDPPAELSGDDYDPARERASWTSCIEHCSLTSEHERPCLVALEERRALARQAARCEQTSRPAGRLRVAKDGRLPWG
jgi:hypothetical protein